MRRRINNAIMAVAMIAVGPTAHAQIAACPQEMASKADDATGSLQTWAQVAAYRSKYQACDDGEIAEGISAATVNLLSTKWNELPALAVQIRHDPHLLPFVLRHIDATVDGRDLETIIQHTKVECPTGHGPLCGKIRIAASQALTDMKAPAN